MKIYVLHYTKLEERKPHMIDELQKQKLTKYEFIEVYDKEDLTEADKALFDPKLKLTAVSLNLKHFHAYRQIAAGGPALIFEDDVILSDSFTAKITDYVAELPEDYDLLFIGDGCNLHMDPRQITPEKRIYEKTLHPTVWGGNGASRSTDSYLVSQKCAQKLCEYVERPHKINATIGWWLNEAARHYKLKVYWAEPTIVTQGSQNGQFKSMH